MFPPITLGRQIKSRLAQELRADRLHKFLEAVQGIEEIECVEAGAVLLYFSKIPPPINGVTEIMLNDARTFMATDNNEVLLEFGTRAMWAEESLYDINDNHKDDSGETDLLLYKIVGLEVSLSWVVPNAPQCNEVKQGDTLNNQRASTPLAFI